MSIFQEKIFQKYLQQSDHQKMQAAWERYQKHFLDADVQQNIRASKEEQYARGFLNDLFVKILGYTLNPEKNFNLTTELKNIKDSKKTDGAILKNDKAIAVIELKGTATTDLSKVEAQAFGYKNNQTGCTYVITSNFEKLRFYIDNAVEHEDFYLFKLTEEKFRRLWLCLAAENLLEGIPLAMKKESLSEEEHITQTLYAEYALFRDQIFADICRKNPKENKLLLFQKTQKLLDRFLFLFFAEDRLLLPPNTTRHIARQWMELRDEYNVYIPLYQRFVDHFRFIKKGNKGNGHYNVFPYNGELFAQDDFLDSLIISDTLLYQHVHNLGKYDYQSEVSVNILGHIFEHSLSEIEEIQSRLEKGDELPELSKRKKDGIFYTPKHITQYIIEQTIGRLCHHKKQALDIADEEKLEQATDEIQTQYHTQLDAYREWLLSLTICDPACGSGAFLNEALEFLIAEHALLDELYEKLTGKAHSLPNIEEQVLANNIFGVDLNEESVEIAKLSLWLRTAKKGRKLTALSQHILCGNSLISDPEIAGAKAFVWEEAFPHIFEKGGFDVVVGNPPWGAKISKLQKDFFKAKNYRDQSLNTAYLFIERGLQLLRKNQLLGYIIPKGLAYVENLGFMRRYLHQSFTIQSIIDTSESFKDSGVELEAIILTIENRVTDNRKDKKVEVGYRIDDKFHSQAVDKSLVLNEECWGIWVNESNAPIIEKVKTKSIPLGTICTSRRGIGINKYVSESETDYIVLGGRCIGRYSLDCLTYVDAEHIQENFSWQKQPKIMLQEIVGRYGKPIFGNYRNIKLNATIDEQGDFYTLDTVVNLFDFDPSYHPKYILALINSKLMSWYFHRYQKSFSQLTIHSGNGNSRRLPIYPLNLERQEEFVILVNKILAATQSFNIQKNRFHRRVLDNLNLDKTSKKIDAFYRYPFKVFIQELKKKKVEFGLKAQDEWESYFHEMQTDVNKKRVDLQSLNQKLDSLVYGLYGLSEAEVRVVEE
ncbi:MAG: N-6 DNA methylase [Bernardetiaceae bacterium]|nr:N-6 DNA methylase [Bernardetiaceae bacterium]